MRELIVTTFLTLDGVMQAPGGPEEDDSGGFAHGGWSVNYWDELMGQVMGEATSIPFAMVLGRTTYDIMAAYWPHASEEAGAKPFNDATKYVASRSHPTLEWSNSVLIDADAAEGIAALKKEDGPELQVHGSGNLIQTLMRHSLVDRYRLWVFPVVIGSGKRLFSDGTIPSGLKLVDSKVSTTGVVIGTYEPAGEIVTGSFAWDDLARDRRRTRPARRRSVTRSCSAALVLTAQTSRWDTDRTGDAPERNQPRKDVEEPWQISRSARSSTGPSAGSPRTAPS